MHILNEISSMPPSGLDKDVVNDKTKILLSELEELQNLMYADGRHSLLIVFQGMDASGKDGAIREIFSGINPMGCKVKSFKKPTEEEMRHEFLWRVHGHAPEKGMIQIFNRSHYEDVVIQRVHSWVDMETVKRRYNHINAFESLLTENGTIVLKFFLHISKQEQLERLNERMTDKRKMWKYNANDLKEREHWDAYMEAYSDAINICSPAIPWMVVPSDKNWYKEYLIASTIVSELKKLNMQFPGMREG